MTRLNKTASLAAGLAAALLLSTSLANAAPAHRDSTRTTAHYSDRGTAPSKFQTKGKTRDARNRQARNTRDRRDGKFRTRFAQRDSRVFRADYDHARYADRYHRPPLRFEARGYAPRAGFGWRNGYWDWHDGQWVWIAGIWQIVLQTHR